MSTVIVTLSTKQQVFPAGTVPAGIKFSLSDGSIAPQTVGAAPYSASFADVAPGTYTAIAQAVDASGNALGDPATSAAFTVSAPVLVDVPDVITVTVNA
ncbi:hypothetical protein [Paraburkholderia unamae]|uniref:Bacterial Ig-like domain-containing protein n=1 Tax=Paraburkholderia unamae TaxID=219649 RepID=A0ABX5KAN1_9BURK|nr:hypothetical protein [Paraburkholderia unamae]PVX61215.1 hypothetical protein C7402_1426 [Paraburkholderia unamae]